MEDMLIVLEEKKVMTLKEVRDEPEVIEVTLGEERDQLRSNRMRRITINLIHK